MAHSHSGAGGQVEHDLPAGGRVVMIGADLEHPGDRVVGDGQHEFVAVHAQHIVGDLPPRLGRGAVLDRAAGGADVERPTRAPIAAGAGGRPGEHDGRHGTREQR